MNIETLARIISQHGDTIAVIFLARDLAEEMTKEDREKFFKLSGIKQLD